MLAYMKNRLLFHYTIIMSGLFLLLLFGAYASGYRLGPGLVLTKEQQITIVGIPNNASVFSDYALHKNIKNNKIVISLIPGNHTLLVSAKGYWPWKYMVTIPENKSISVRAFLIPRVQKGKILTGVEKANAEKKIKMSITTSVDGPLHLTNVCMTLSISNNQVIATPISDSSSCTPPPYLCSGNTCAPTIIFSSGKKISRLMVYPERNDAILVEIANTVYALSIDPRAPRTFAPLLKGIHPIIAQGKGSTLLVQDEKTVYQLTL